MAKKRIFWRSMGAIAINFFPSRKIFHSPESVSFQVQASIVVRFPVQESGLRSMFIGHKDLQKVLDTS